MLTQENRVILVSDVMLPFEQCPVIDEREILKEALERMGHSRLGMVCIVNKENTLLGILTDGDIRRSLLKVQKPFSAFFVDDALVHAIKSPVSIQAKDTLVDAVALMEERQVWDLPVVNADNKLEGLLHLHPAVKALLGVES